MTGVTWTAIVLTPYRPRLQYTTGHAYNIHQATPTNTCH